jgi:hypothetical protein
MKRVTIIFIFIMVIAPKLQDASASKLSVLDIIKMIKSDDSILFNKACDYLTIDYSDKSNHECISGFDKVQLLMPVLSDNKSIYIIAISWENNTNSYLIILNSDGKVLQKIKIGYIKSIMLIQLRNDNYIDTLAIEANVGAGTGINIDKYYIYAMNSQSFLEIWQGLSNDTEWPGDIAPLENYVSKGVIHFEDIDHDGIKELGYEYQKTQYLYNKGNNKWVPKDVQSRKEIYKIRNGIYVLSNDQNRPR